MPDIFQIAAESAVMLTAPDDTSEAGTELLYGEKIEILDDLGDWVHAKNLTDDYTGYLWRAALNADTFAPTHKITALRSFLYPDPDFKQAPLASLPFFAQLLPIDETADETAQGFTQLHTGGWIWSDHLMPLDQNLTDPLHTAQKFIDAPYLWGGRTSAGIDCSALVQLSLLAAGHPCPRDTKDQIEIGKDIPAKKRTPGDLIFFDGHVGFAIDDNQLLNATARTMDVRIENLDDVIRHYGAIKTVRRVK